MNMNLFKRLRNIFVLSIILISISLFCSINTGCINTMKEKKGSIYAFSTYIDITLYYENQDIDNIYKEVTNILNDYNKLTNRFENYQNITNIYTINNSEEFVSVDKKLFDVILLSLDLKMETEGYFEPLIGNLSVLYKNLIQTEPFDENMIPTDDMINSELEKIKNTNVVINDSSIKLEGEATLDLGAVAKGYALLKVKEYLEEVNITHYIIDAGMSSIIVGEKPIDKYYKIGLNNTNKYFKLKNKAIGTSSITSQLIEYNGNTYHHIINPKTGKPDNQFDTVYIIGDNPFIIDALSTAFISMTEEEIETIVEKLKEKGIEIEYYLYKDNTLINSNKQ